MCILSILAWHGRRWFGLGAFKRAYMALPEPMQRRPRPRFFLCHCEPGIISRQRICSGLFLRLGCMALGVIIFPFRELINNKIGILVGSNRSFRGGKFCFTLLARPPLRHLRLF